MQKIRIKKVGVPSDPNYKTPSWEQYKLGQDNGDISLPIEYEAEGYERNAPSVGSSYVVARTSRIGVPKLGIFCTSEIKNIIKLTETSFCFETNNSTYMLEYIND